MTKGFWIVLAVIVLAFIGVAAFKNSDSSNSNEGASGTPTSHIKGSASSGVKLVEYGDYQCPACGAFYPTVEEVYAKYQDKIQFQFRNFPLSSIHQNAFAGSRAAEAAGMQGKYWGMHDLLYENQNSWSGSATPLKDFKSYAQQLGLNIKQFENNYYSNKVNTNINADKNRGEELEVEATPTFFLGGKKLSNDQTTDENGQPSIEAFSKLIDAAIAKGKNQAAN